MPNPVHELLKGQPSSTMEIPNQLAYPAILALAGFVVRTCLNAYAHLRPKSANGNGGNGNGKRVSIQEALDSINGNLVNIREVDLPDIRTRVGGLERSQDRMMRRLDRLEGTRDS